MIKENVRKLAALSISLSLAMSYTVFAQTNLSPKEGCNSIECKKTRIGDRKESFSKLINELGLTEKDITGARSNGKTLFDLAKAKGYTPEQVRSMAVKIKTEALNKAVSEGNLTKEQAEEITKKIQEKTSKWDGSLDLHNGKHESDFSRRLAEIKELGLTAKDIDEAKKSNKSLFDLAKEKKGLTPEKVKALLINMKAEKLKEDVSEGELTQDKADEIISKYKTRIESWDGKFKSHKRED